MTYAIVLLVVFVLGAVSIFIVRSRSTSSQDLHTTVTPPQHVLNQAAEDVDQVRTEQLIAARPTRLIRSEPAAPKTHKSGTRRTPGFEVPSIFATVDLETTGFSAGMDEIIEIGALKCAGLDGEVLEFSTLVRPTNPIPPGITATTGITQEMVDGLGVSLLQAVEKLQAFLSDVPIIGYRVGFDLRFLKCASDQHDLSFSNRYLDVLEMARDAYPHLPSHKLEDVALMLNLSNENAHRALADCRRTLAVFRHVVTKLDGRRYAWSDPRDLPVIETGQPRSERYEQVLNHVGTHYPARQGNADGHMHGERVVFTGDLSIPRSEAIERAIAAGCDVIPNVNRKVTIVVSGFRDPSLYNGKAKSGKLLKAEELVNEGYPLRILTEAEFFKLLGTTNLN
ncbi:exonuclease domain-containing protein [Occallatibacter savannae]|uniref:exonuclease domain-containing protein n=1 Tax=Occallatibacter savannae TaxID=1002691 RepID=UPI000D69B58E|nr:exonuclease domain-containing protein [Occallatibacter savannae]